MSVRPGRTYLSAARRLLVPSSSQNLSNLSSTTDPDNEARQYCSCRLHSYPPDSLTGHGLVPAPREPSSRTATCLRLKRASAPAVREIASDFPPIPLVPPVPLSRLGSSAPPPSPSSGASVHHASGAGQDGGLGTATVGGGAAAGRRGVTGRIGAAWPAGRHRAGFLSPPLNSQGDGAPDPRRWPTVA
ncbi:hypothetical protein SETIT_9G565100v2 [Setaria italica]|uniref:Uncharacterized protein n=1 Tax=Setaria italica TaxID=4555 RepID=A0A368SWQ5_SETIT|nr:hypothetical protein SETIT_9G565100v2 [Setaria italica]